MDPESKFIKYRLYRHHTSISGVSFVKDLTKLGRDLSKVIIIDNLRDNFKLQPNNGLEIKTWCEEIRDNQLKDIKIMLQGLIFRKPNDIRAILKKLKVEITKRMKKNSISPYANIDIEKFNQP